MSWTKEQLQEHERRHPARGRTWTGASKEEQQDALSWKADNQTGVPEVDSKVRPKFRISVDLFYSDKRRRDGDGAATTLADCIITARRRLLDEA